MPLNEAVIQYRIDRAYEALEDAKFALDNNRLRNAANRIYYAGFYIVSALAIKNEFNTAKHFTLIGWFNKNFVKTKQIDIEIGKSLLRAFEMRQESDYDDYVELVVNQVQMLYDDMTQFVKKVESLIYQT